MLFSHEYTNIRLQILLVVVISTAWAETTNVERPVRAPQRQVKYDDVDGELTKFSSCPS